MTPTHIDSPIRRSAVGGQFAVTDMENDDEAERRDSRARVSSVVLNDSMINQHKEGLDNCLRIFNDNKISKDNVWQMALIDHFRALIDKHHKTLTSFQIVGSSLEASSKIYAIRVDSVHADVLRMSSGLIRQKILENAEESVAAETTIQNEQPLEEEGERPARKKKRVNRVVTTVTKNKDTINAKLEKSAEIDAIFAKLNSTIGNSNSANKLLQYVLSSKESQLLLRMNYKVWKNEDAQINDPNATDYLNDNITELPDLNWNPSNNEVLRPQITGYVISNTPAEDDGNDPVDVSPEKTTDANNLNLQFNIDATVEPIDNDNGFMDIDADIDFNSLTEDDQQAIGACRRLHRQRTTVDDLRPLDTSSLNLEYSYRVLNDRITQFWAGPSFWKFKRMRESSTKILQTATKTRKAFKNKLEPTVLEEDIGNDNIFTTAKSRQASKLKKANIYKRFDQKKTKLPQDFKLERNRFLYLSLQPATPLLLLNNNSPHTELDTNDNDSHAGVDHDLTMANDDFDSVGFDEPANENFNFVEEENNATVAEIQTNFVDAPEQVNQINVKFAKTAKVVDMKQLKTCCLDIIRSDCVETAATIFSHNTKNSNEEYIDGASSFYQIYKKLPEKLTRNMKEALSPAVAFYSILHLANENNLRLEKDDVNGFYIRQIR